MTTHTKQCLGATERIKLEISKYDSLYPNYCPTCNGTGGHSWYENGAPYGSGEYWPMDNYEMCEKCLGAGKCPRCGEQHGESWYKYDSEPCNFCGWEDGDRGRPQLGECECWYDELAMERMSIEDEVLAILGEE